MSKNFMSILPSRTPVGIADAVSKLLLGNALAAVEAGEYLTQNNIWSRAVDVAGIWHVIPTLRKRLESLDIIVSPDQKERLQRLSIAAAAQTMLVAHRGATVLNELSKAGISTAVFKGVALLANLYKSPAERMVGDVDLLIKDEDLFRTSAVLHELGFTPQVSIGLDEWLSHIENRIHPTHDYLVFVDDSKVELDVHWKFGVDTEGTFSSPSIVDRAEEADLLGIAVRVATPADSMILTAHHVVRDYFRPGTSIKDLCDLAAWWNIQPERWQVKETVEHASECGLSKALLALWMILTDFNPESRAAEGVDALITTMTNEEQAQARRLRAFFHLQLQEGEVDQVLIGLTDFGLGKLKRFLAYETKIKRKRVAFQKLTESKRGTRLPGLMRTYRLLRSMLRITPQRVSIYKAAVQERTFFQALYEGKDQL